MIQCDVPIIKTDKESRTTSVPKTHQISYRNRPDRRITPVLNWSNFMIESALCEKDSAKMSVKSADLLDPGST